MAQRILRPTVTTFLDLALEYRTSDIQMEEIPINPDSPLNDVILKDSGIRQNFNLIIIAIKKPDGHLIRTGLRFQVSFDQTGSFLLPSCLDRLQDEVLCITACITG